MHLFLPYELSVIAKEKGFNEKCLTYYGLDTKLRSEYGWFVNNAMSGKQATAPLYQQIVDWFRETHNIQIIVEKNYKTNKFVAFVCDEISANWEEHDEFYGALNKAIQEELYQL